MVLFCGVHGVVRAVRVGCDACVVRVVCSDLPGEDIPEEFEGRPELSLEEEKVLFHIKW